MADAVFWIGFNIAMFPASLIVKHRGGLVVMGVAGLLGSVAVLVAQVAGGLNTEIVAQFIARRGLGLHADERGLSLACDRPYRGRAR